MLLLWYQLPTGRSAIGNISAAREDYDAQKGSHAWSLAVKGRDNRSFTDIAGTYPVIGPYGETGFILETPQGPRSLCHTGTCDWYPEHASLIKGQPEITTTTTVQADRTSTGALVQSLAPLQAVGQVYLLGTLSARRIPAMPPTVEVTGEKVSLHYAAATVLTSWSEQPLTDLDLTIQVRHAPGVVVPEIHLPAATEGEGIHPLLRQWVEAAHQAGN